jgi:tubulin--tyrosine ligase
MASDSVLRQTHFGIQPLPNAFELYGVDFLVTHVEVDAASSSSSTKLQVKLLEINAEPAIELTGPRLTWILEDLFIAIGNVCVEPFFDRAQDREGGMAVWDIGQTRFGLRKCLEVAMERSA